MISPGIPADEAQRLRALHNLHILDTAAEERFDRITRLAVKVFDLPIAYVALVDENRQWFKSKCGLDSEETTRDVSFCGHAILEDQTLVIPDALQDERFHDNPLVTGPPHVRFYAGRPLRAPGGEKVGTLCLVSTEPREMDASELKTLDELADLVERELHLTDTIELQASRFDALADTALRLVEAQEHAEAVLDIVVPLGIALSSESNYASLLENTLAQAKKLTGADAGILLLCSDSGELTRGLVALDGSNEAMAWLREAESVGKACGAPDPGALAVCEVARTTEPVNVVLPTDAVAAGFADVAALRDSHGYAAASVLLEPLRGGKEQVVGVLQLLSTRTASGGEESVFTEHAARAMQALSSLTGAALENYDKEQQLRQRIESLELQIDEARRDQDVKEITESEFFTELLERASGFDS
jgi:GAF domain-containing protein